MISESVLLIGGGIASLGTRLKSESSQDMSQVSCFGFKGTIDSKIRTSMDAGDAALQVGDRTDHGCLGEGYCILDSDHAVAAVLDCVGGGDGQEESNEIVDLDKFHYRYLSRI